MREPSSKTVQLSGHNPRTDLSRDQKTFQRLIRQIDKQRQKLALWQKTNQQLHSTYYSKIEPLQQTMNELREQLLILLDTAHPNKIFGKRDKAQLSHLICHLAYDLIVNHDRADLKPIYNRHSALDFDAQEEAKRQAQNAEIKELLGIDLDNFQPFDMMAHVQNGIRQRELEEAERQSKKSAKTLAKEARQAQEAENVRQSLREVYRKLASALHPDREPDADQHQRKTNLMQRVNQAYEQKDLLQLLELQLEIEQIDQILDQDLSAERLKHYNKILREQLDGLQRQVMVQQDLPRMMLDLSPEITLTPAKLRLWQEQDIQQLRATVDSIKHDLLFLQNYKNIKAWLKK